VGLHVLNARSAADIDEAFAAASRLGIGALVVVATPLFVGQRDQIVALAARHRLPTVYPFRNFADAGGLMSYGDSLTDAFRHTGNYTGRILKGEKPGDLPVVQPAKFELVINLKTAKALGIEVPAKLLALVDEVLE
jgi:putative ABC transport system substrate-binding protein